ncbi:uncharacterized protein LOC119793666 isoform X2 [Cyprinodon tularosa]|uniref:uncharacterized protein LOC119793666 isoform X2 n=1 Tax=Cyprinodon tularosa TaxID=77115 RepID=UPI0018E247EC|nr:uncharacterized protein LOC119793666 isoform X2 [Cyprinodon tularosa]
MSSVQPLREFIRERLTAAAEEIFTEVEKTIVRYEEDIRLMEIYKKNQTTPNLIDVEKPHVSTEEATFTIRQLCNQRRKSTNRDIHEADPEWAEEVQMQLDPPLIEKLGEPGPPWFKEEEEDLKSLIKKENEEPESSRGKEEQKTPGPLSTGKQEGLKLQWIKQEEDAEEPAHLLIKEEDSNLSLPQLKRKKWNQNPP